jgi:rubredoxin
MDRYQCLECAYIYDPAKGDPTQGIPPGTPFEKLPPGWRCPECKISILKHGAFRRLTGDPRPPGKREKKKRA